MWRVVEIICDRLLDKVVKYTIYRLMDYAEEYVYYHYNDSKEKAPLESSEELVSYTHLHNDFE